ncbi:hypothetical protein [Halioglobus maricola]|nr:hypothetical protein [Halioglobus maricola]
MTQHFLEDDTLADKKAMRQLATVIGIFALATIALAAGVAFVAG